VVGSNQASTTWAKNVALAKAPVIPNPLSTVSAKRNKPRTAFLFHNIPYANYGFLDTGSSLETDF
jgi:hypothetical protein